MEIPRESDVMAWHFAELAAGVPALGSDAELQPGWCCTLVFMCWTWRTTSICQCNGCIDDKRKAWDWLGQQRAHDLARVWERPWVSRHCMPPSLKGFQQQRHVEALDTFGAHMGMDQRGSEQRPLALAPSARQTMLPDPWEKQAAVRRSGCHDRLRELRVVQHFTIIHKIISVYTYIYNYIYIII